MDMVARRDEWTPRGGREPRATPDAPVRFLRAVSLVAVGRHFTNTTPLEECELFATWTGSV